MASTSGKIRVLVVNPNASKFMTDKCIDMVKPTLAPDVEVIGFTSPEPAPTAVEGNFDGVMSAAAAMRALIPIAHEYDAFLVACYSDHALIRMLREEFDQPSIGIMEASLFAARILGNRFGLIATSKRSKAMHEDSIRHYGFDGFCSGVGSCNLGVLDFDLKSEEEVLSIMCGVAKDLVAQGADCLTLGCAGMTKLKKAVEDAVGEDVQVIDGVLAGVQHLSGLVRMGGRTAKSGIDHDLEMAEGALKLIHAAGFVTLATHSREQAGRRIQEPLTNPSLNQQNILGMILVFQVDPAQAQGAQIPLQTFSLPQFPPQAGALKALTLTSDIKLDDYQTLLSESFTIPPLPPGIESLTLELFTLGYPVGWLSQLADRLPNLKSLVIYSQLFGGVSEESQADGVEFFKKLPGLRALHLLDVFAQPKFFESIGPYVTHSTDEESARRGLMFLEINYTVQHSDPEFLGKIQATELSSLVGPGLVTLAFNVSEADVTDDPDDPTNNTDKSAEEAAKDGVVALNRTLGSTLVKALTDEATRPRGLRVLNSTLFTLTTTQLRTILEKQKALMVLNATLEVDNHETFKKDMLSILPSLDYLEQVEIVANPSLQFFLAIQNIKHKAFESTFPSASEIQTLGEKCKRLSSFKADILRSSAMQTIEWEKKDDKWSGGIKAAKTELKITELE
ncbi:hypothetical protein D6D17_01112 [Aureobasidium pullulans]|uniref:Hydantoin racemase n=1 Tax=Aureobasidium pullulans TaxID=5580 RepID=A0A4S9DG61_AURPU|nr:hypothetical protein D6D17_01112 [Aureobasidium pullulans]TIA30726.1 hypothetical protein D6C78_09407 [Aureobasidium pullulans]